MGAPCTPGLLASLTGRQLATRGGPGKDEKHGREDTWVPTRRAYLTSGTGLKPPRSLLSQPTRPSYHVEHGTWAHGAVMHSFGPTVPPTPRIRALARGCQRGKVAGGLHVSYACWVPVPRAGIRTGRVSRACVPCSLGGSVGWGSLRRGLQRRALGHRDGGRRTGPPTSRGSLVAFGVILLRMEGAALAVLAVLAVSAVSAVSAVLASP